MGKTPHRLLGISGGITKAEVTLNQPGFDSIKRTPQENNPNQIPEVLCIVLSETAVLPPHLLRLKVTQF